jgi:hypothetical protein
MDGFLGWFCFYVHLSSIIQHPSIHPSIPHGVPVAGCFTAAALVLLQLRSDHAKAQILREFHEEFAVCGWVEEESRKKLAERSNNENPVVVVMKDLNHAVMGNFAVICATKFNAG